MLHLIFQSLSDHSVLQRIEVGDDVVFYENACFSIDRAGRLHNQLQQLLKQAIQLYVLQDELNTRGIKNNDIVEGIEVIDYPKLVQLTEKNKLIRTWN